jgi:hypothetical protein
MVKRPSQPLPPKIKVIKPPGFTAYYGGSGHIAVGEEYGWNIEQLKKIMGTRPDGSVGIVREHTESALDKWVKEWVKKHETVGKIQPPHLQG